MKRTLLALALTATGCSITGTAELPSPRNGGAVAPNVASVPTVLSELFDFPEGALTSRATLVSVDAEATCFDLLLRRPAPAPKDGPNLHLKVEIEVDGVVSSGFKGELSICTPERACLPPSSALQGFVAETDPRVRVEAVRMCFQKLPRARRELVLSANPGIGTWRFKFHFTDEDR
ncbi:MAG: hypothetical protein ABJE95_35435 [Byssovorax sp.]